MHRKVVWKWPLLMTPEQELELPANAHILCVQMQGPQPCLWALVDATLPTERRKIVLAGTGNEDETLGRRLNYLGTFQTNHGTYVWHVFEDVDAAELANADAFVEHVEKPEATQEELLARGI